MFQMEFTYILGVKLKDSFKESHSDVVDLVKAAP